MLKNTRALRIEWCDCDPAGIVYYPRYFEMFDTSTTALIERALGMTKYQYLKSYEFAGHPLVETRGRFFVPTRFGDEVTVETQFAEAGRSSFKVDHRLFKDGALAVEGFETRVWVRWQSDDRSRLKSHPIPAEVLARFAGA